MGLEDRESLRSTAHTFLPSSFVKTVISLALLGWDQNPLVQLCDFGLPNGGTDCKHCSHLFPLSPPAEEHQVW